MTEFLDLALCPNCRRRQELEAEVAELRRTSSGAPELIGRLREAQERLIFLRDRLPAEAGSPERLADHGAAGGGGVSDDAAWAVGLVGLLLVLAAIVALGYGLEAVT